MRKTLQDRDSYFWDADQFNLICLRGDTICAHDFDGEKLTVARFLQPYPITTELLKYMQELTKRFVLEFLRFMKDDDKLLFDCQAELDDIVRHAQSHNTRGAHPTRTPTDDKDWSSLQYAAPT